MGIGDEPHEQIGAEDKTLVIASAAKQSPLRGLEIAAQTTRAPSAFRLLPSVFYRRFCMTLILIGCGRMGAGLEVLVKRPPISMTFAPVRQRSLV